jgi:hypothetical protein
MEELLTTVEALVSANRYSAPQVRADLERLEAMAAKANSSDDGIKDLV